VLYLHSAQVVIVRLDAVHEVAPGEVGVLHSSCYVDRVETPGLVVGSCAVCGFHRRCGKFEARHCQRVRGEDVSNVNGGTGQDLLDPVAVE